jgi:addiction module RelE/StbE family toxin
LRIRWSKEAKNNFVSIKKYWDKRNSSNQYSKSLFLNITTNLENVVLFPDIGLKTNNIAIRYLVVENYLVFYHIREIEILVIKIWDSRRNPDDLSIIN